MSEALKLLDNQVLSLPVDSIAANPYQPRRVFHRIQLEELAKSIREYGVIQPITVRLINGRVYELVAGERRLRASKLAGRPTIPAIVVNINDKDSAMLALIENVQRKDLNFIEEAEGLRYLISDFGFTQERLAEKIGKTQSTIANKLRLLKLPLAIQQRLVENSLTERHARALLLLNSEDDMNLVIEKIITEGLNVSKTEALIAKLLELKNNARYIGHIRIKTLIKDLRIFTNTIKDAVDTMNSSGIKTDYELEEQKSGCVIKIAVSY